MGLAVAVQGLVDAIGHPEQCQLAERSEVAGAEVVAHRGVDLLGRVDVAVGHAAADRLRCHVDQLDLVGAAHDDVRDRLALDRAGDLVDDVVERLEVLDVDGGDHVDAGVEHLLDVLPALLVLGPRDVGVRVLVDEGHVRSASQYGSEIHLQQRRAAVLDRSPGHDLQALQLCGGLRPPVRLDHADDDVGPPLDSPASLVEHGEGLADPRGRTQVDTQRAAARLHRQALPPVASSSARFNCSTFTAGTPRTPSVRPSV